MSVLQDIRLALRLCWRNPSFACIAVLSIILSVGATTVVFTAIKAVLINPLPYARPEELVQIRAEFANFDPSQSHSDWALPTDAREIIRRTGTLASVGTYGNIIFNLAGDSSSPPESLYGLRVSANLFTTLGVSPMLGRNISPGEDLSGHANEMILSYGLWARRFNSDPRVIGRTVNVDGNDCLIIGVMPPEFNFPLRRQAVHTPSPYVEFWTPFRGNPDESSSGAIGVVARLRPGVTLAQARQDLASIGAALSREFPATNRDHTLRLGFLFDRTVGSARNSLLFLMGASLMFLLIGCANVANLLLARGLVRQREIAIRIAVGAGRMRIIRQLLTESCVLATLGGLGGYALTVVAWKILPAIVPVNIPRLAAARADWQVLAFAILVAVANGLLFGIAPALGASRMRVNAAHAIGADGGASGKGNRIRGLLVVAEVAITVSLVIIGGQLLRKFVDLVRTDPGFESDHILASIVLPSLERYPTAEARGILYRKFLDSIRVLPGVESAGTVDALPFSGENNGGLIAASETAVHDPNQQTPAEIDIVSSEYLETMGVHLSEGRWFRGEEMAGSSKASDANATNGASDAGTLKEVAIVNDVAGHRLWPGESAIGKRICVFCTPEKPNNWKRVIGVVATVQHAVIDGPLQANVYLSARAFQRAQFLVIRTNRPLADMERSVRVAIASVDPNQPVFLTVSMRTLIADTLADRRFIMALLAIIGCLALAMSVAGVYGVTSYVTSRRTREIGLRMALGATPGDVQFLVFRQGFLTVVIGIAFGLAATLALVRVLQGLVPGFEFGNPGGIWIAVGFVSLTAGVACWIPARRAAKLDPMSALRQD
jgi:predicted permease